MANAASINSLLPIVRSRLNLTNMATITDAEIKTFLRSSCAQLYEIIANRHRDYYIAIKPMNFQANVDTYPLPNDFRSAVQVFITFGTSGGVATTQRMAIEQFSMNRYSAQSLSTLLQPQWPMMYRIMGGNLIFTPAPSTDYTSACELWYIPQWPGIPTDTQSIDTLLPNGWERWVEFDTCVQIAARLRLPDFYAIYTKEREKIEEMVIKAASIRNEQPEYMTDAFDVPFFGLNKPGS